LVRVGILHYVIVNHPQGRREEAAVWQCGSVMDRRIEGLYLYSTSNRERE
jgi:hypothetical protein